MTVVKNVKVRMTEKKGRRKQERESERERENKRNIWNGTSEGI